MQVKILLQPSFDVEGLKSFEVRDKFVIFTCSNGEQFQLPVAAFAGIGFEKAFWSYSDKFKKEPSIFDFGSEK